MTLPVPHSSAALWGYRDLQGETPIALQHIVHPLVFENIPRNSTCSSARMPRVHASNSMQHTEYSRELPTSNQLYCARQVNILYVYKHTNIL